MFGKIFDRFLIFFIVIIIFFGIVIIKAAQLQLVNSADMASQVEKKYYNETKIIKATRGDILDRNGVPIACHTTSTNINMTMRKGLTNTELNEIVGKLITILEKNGEKYKHSFEKYIKINPFEYGSSLSKREDKVSFMQIFTGLPLKDLGLTPTCEEFFKAMRQDFYIDEDLDDEKAYKIMALRFDLLWASMGKFITIAEDVKPETIAEVTERKHELPGTSTEVIPERVYYNDSLVAHVLGFINKVNQDDLDAAEEGRYKNDDLIGRTGVEKSAEAWLKGYDGEKGVEIDQNGKTVRISEDKPAIPGNNVILTLDLNLQKTAMESLERNIKAVAASEDDSVNFGDANAGSVVMLDVNTGEVLVMASYPTYSSSIFLAKSDDKAAQKAITDLYQNTDSPSLNRAIQGLYAPGSTFKPLTAIAALEEGTVKPGDYINDTGVLDVDGHMFYCMRYRKYGAAHGLINLTHALETSCNMYFHIAAIETGIDKIDKWAKNFGLGEKTGIDLPGEYKGRRNNRQTKNEIDTGAGWVKADTAQAAIGQLYNEFTPLQIANYVASIANGGTMHTPYIIKKVVDNDFNVVMETQNTSTRLPVKSETISAVKAGMVAVANDVDGTAVEIFRDFPAGITVAGKTGTPETGREALKQSSNGVFICYAPADNPKVAVVVVLEKGVWGSNAAPVAKDLLVEYFKLNAPMNIDDSQKIKSDEGDLTK